MPPSFILAQRSIFAFTSCSNFLFTPRPYNTSKPQNDPGKGKKILYEGRDEGNPETKKKKYPLHRPCRLSLLYYVCSLFPSILFLPFLSYCGNVLQVCCILTCKSRRIIDFLTSLENKPKDITPSQVWWDAALPSVSVPNHCLCCEEAWIKMCRLAWHLHYRAINDTQDHWHRCSRRCF